MGLPLINRELSWLSFNDRVLQEAKDVNVPIMERLRFLGIFSNNQDEFFRVRVATLIRMIALGKRASQFIGPHPKKVLRQIFQKAIEQQFKFENLFDEIRTELEHENIFILNEAELNNSQEIFVSKYFRGNINTDITPILLENINKLPEFNDSTTFLVVEMSKANSNRKKYAIIEIPTKTNSRFLVLPKSNGKNYVILLDDVIRHNLDYIFKTFKFDDLAAYTIKFTRDAELDFENDETKTILEEISNSVAKRKSGQPVRIVYDSKMPNELYEYLADKFNVMQDDNIIPGGRYHNFKDFMSFPNFDRQDLEYPLREIIPFGEIENKTSLIKRIAKKDLLLFYPYHSFSIYLDLLAEASMDPAVKKIQIALYRVAGKSQVVNHLIKAAKNGKDVVVVFELQARFDEENNIKWALILEESGIHVIYGIKKLKVHSKILLITREEKGELKYLGSIGTGNFNEKTSGIYSDIMLLTSKKEYTDDLINVFNFINHPSKPVQTNTLILSPTSTRSHYVNLIEKEIDQALLGNEAWIHLKMNSLVDKKMIKKLYKASKAGVKIKLNVRGICSLIPGKPGFSENIEAISIVDRNLEHSRVFVFCNSGNPLYYISSADWMTRNLDLRLEVAAPILDDSLKAQLDKFLSAQWKDNVKSRNLINQETNPNRESNSSVKFRSQFEMLNILKN
ncbi:MAG: polyphosphate kinase [Sphingobacteriales bacterium]|jgi:polyphosphate kinase